MAGKKNTGKGRKADKAKAEVRPKLKEKALPMDENLANEQLAVMPDAPTPPNEPVSIQEVEAELAANPQGGSEKALPMDENLANEQLAVMPDAPTPPNEPVSIQEVEAELAANPQGDSEKALPMDENLANEQLAVMPDAPTPPNEPVSIQEVEAELAANPQGGSEKALPMDENLANEQLAVMPDAPTPPNEPVSIQEVEAELAVNPQGGSEKALPMDENLANEQVAVIPDAPTPPNEPVSIQEVEAELASQPAGGGIAGATVKAAPPKPQKPQIGPAGPRMPNGISPRPLYKGNPYLPHVATVFEIVDETSNIRTLRLVLDDEQAQADFTFEPGQVGQLSVFGAGEATFVINSPPSQKKFLQFSVMKVGEVTDAIHKLSVGDKVGLRAPLGNFFPYHDWRGKNVFFIGGGIGMAPIRTIMLYLL